MYISVDIETTGLNPFTDQILEIAAVAWTDNGYIEDQPYFHEIVDPRRDQHGELNSYIKIQGDPTALVMNMRILEKLSMAPEVYCPGPERAVELFNKWVQAVVDTHGEGDIYLLGKNFASMDLQFLKRVPGWNQSLFHYRILDVGALYADEHGIPGVPKYFDIPGEKHEALYDARIALEAARAKLTAGESCKIRYWNDFDLTNANS